MSLEKFKKIVKETPEHIKERVKLEMDLLDAWEEIKTLKVEVGRLQDENLRLRANILESQNKTT